MLSLPNTLSLLRAPLAFFFLSNSVSLRILAIILAMTSDSIDGYLARKNGTNSQFGAILDPIMDKFFVLFVLMVLMFEGRLEGWQVCATISRDFSLLLFAVYLGISGHWNVFQCKALRWGKISTALQFLVLIGLTLGIIFPFYVYFIFILFGTLAFIELCQVLPTTKKL